VNWLRLMIWVGSSNIIPVSEQGIDSTSAHDLFLLISLFVFMDAAAGSAK
jgi:predicted Kef-type K+ transport protein